jgi:O-antigen/teichoic acid export membrane protein
MPPDQQPPASSGAPQTASAKGPTATLRSLVILLSGQGARQGYLAAVDQGVISLSNFTATLILARSVSPTELGVYGVGFIALRLARSIQEGLVVQPLNVFGASLEDESFKHYATTVSLIQIGLALLSSLAVALGGWLLIKTGNDTAGPALFSLWSPFLWWQLQEYLRRMLYTRGAVFSAVVNSALANAIRMAILLWWLTRGELSGTAGLYAIGWGSLAALLPGLWFTRPYWSRAFNPLEETLRRHWDFGRWIMGGSIANWIAVEFYPVLTAGMISFAAAGAYRALQNLVAPVHLLLRATDTFLTPRAARDFSRNGRKALSGTLRRIYLLSGAPILGILAIAVLFPAPILRLFYGETYLAYSSGVALMALFYALWYAYWPLQTAFKASQVSRPIFIANLAAILSMFTLGIWAIQRWGVYGTIAGQALNSLVVSLVLWAAWFRGVKKRG